MPGVNIRFRPLARATLIAFAESSELARGQCLHLGDRIHRALNRAGGRARVEYGHVRSEVGLHRVNQSERFNKEKIIENSPGGDFHMGVEVSSSEIGVSAARLENCCVLTSDS